MILRKKEQLAIATVLLSSVLTFGPISSVFAAPVTTSWDTDNVTITNNVGKADTVKVTGLTAGSTVNVYDKATGGKLIGTAKVPTGQTEVTVTIANFDVAGRKVYISVVAESTASEFTVEAEAKTDKADAADVASVNNVGKADTLTVKAAVGTIIKVYDSETAGKILGTATVAAGKTEAIVSIAQIGAAETKVYVSATEAGKLESDRLEVTVAAEAKTAKVAASDVVAANNVGKADTLTVTAAAGTIVKVYDLETAGKVLATATVAAGKTEAVVSIAQVGTGETKVYVSATEAGKLESDRLEVTVAAEAKTAKVAASDVVAANNVGKADTLTVTVAAGTIVKVYDLETAGKVLGTATVAAGKKEAIVSIAQVGTAETKVYVSATEAGKLESDRLEVTVAAEAKTAKVAASDVVAVNNVGKADTLTVTAAAGTIVKVYDLETAGKVLATATVAAGKTEAIVSIAQVGTAETKVYVSATEAGKLESDRLEVTVAAEAKTAKVAASDVVAVNNAGKADTLTVTAAAGTVVKVYDLETAGKVLGTATVAAGKKEAIVSIAQIGAAETKVYVSATEAGKLESVRLEVTVAAEAKTAKVAASDVVAVNNVGKADTLTVTAAAGTIVKVYDLETAGKVLATATVAAGKTEAIVSIAQLGAAETKVYVSATEAGKLESDRLEVTVAAEAKTAKVAASDVVAVNNVGKADTLTVTAAAGTIVKVYDLETAGKVLATATVAAGKTEAVVSIAQVGTGETKVYVSATEAGKQESDRLEVTVAAEAKTAKVAASDVVAVNNAGSADTFTVKAAVGTIVKVYDLETAGKVLGTATVAAGKTEAVVSIAQVGTAETKVYVSATETGKLESDRLEVTLAAEGKTDKVATGNITVANNVGKADTITVPAAVGAVVKVYDAATAGKLLGSAAVATGKTEGIVSISQLGVDATKVYVSVTETGKQESEREEVAVAAEAVTIAPAESAITIVNNAGKADTITVTDVVAGDIVKIFRTGTTTVIGSAIIAAGKLEATISIAQLGVDASSVDVTITSKDKRESTKTTKSYDAEA